MTETPSTPSPSSLNVAAIPAHQPDARLLQSVELFAGQREVLIAHGQEVYRLRLTRSNKLILHK